MTEPEATPSGPWDEAFEQLAAWDRTWATTCAAMTNSAWASGVLPRRLVELIGVALNVACTNLNADGTRRHIRAALAEGASRDEILTVIKMASVMSIHSCSLGAPILIEESKAAGATAATEASGPTPACDRMRSMGQWNVAWDPFFDLDAMWTEQFIATGVGIYAGGVFTAKETELLSIAFDASFTHMYAPGTRRHIKGALAAGATREEIMTVLKLCVAQGVQACNLGVPILAEEIERANRGAAA